MKAFCNTCGCHFPEEFKDTLKPTCNWWGDRGASNVPEEWKKKIWEWQFGVNVDQFLVETGLSLNFSLGFTVPNKSDTFEAQVEGWSKMTDKERRNYEKEHFRKLWREPKKSTTIDLKTLTEDQLVNLGSAITNEFRNRHT